MDYLQGLDLDVKLVHAKKARVIAENTTKTDKIDARILAHLDRCNFLPQAYITEKKTRSQRELLRYYMGLVSIRTGVKNRVHTILAKNNVKHDFSDPLLQNRHGIFKRTSITSYIFDGVARIPSTPGRTEMSYRQCPERN